MMKISAFKALAILWVLGFVYAAGYSMGGGGYGGGLGGFNGWYGGGYGGNYIGKKGYGTGTSSVLLLPVASGKGIGGIGGGFGGGGGEFGGILNLIFPRKLWIHVPSFLAIHYSHSSNYMTIHLTFV
ncbi:hypothetical protein ACJMK2_033082 [Sinanodonta woodiana]|uniref:Glycine-rich protein n=1 Tax=Sinanodonta woodiana TaxID=1069815 RepID=A0ABD3X598_SINWO